MPSNRRQRGFTLLELMVVVSVVGVLVGIALPNFATMSLSAARTQGGTMLLTAFNQARSEAVARNSDVIVCQRKYLSESNPPAAGTFPICDATGTGDWARGWIVYQDTTASTDKPGKASDIIAVYDPIGNVKANPAATDNYFTVLPASNPVRVTFSANGRASSSLRFTICNPSKKLTDARQVEIALSGFISLRRLLPAETTTTCG